MNLTPNYIEADILNQENLKVKTLIKTASLLNDIKDKWDINKSQLENILNDNYKFWEIFAKDVSHDIDINSSELKYSIANFANYVFKKTRDILANPNSESISELVDINMNVAKGLSEVVFKNK